jgi:PAS domain S-box-containing protein
MESETGRERTRGSTDRKDKYRALFESNPDAVFLTIPDGRIRAANPAACVMFGMTEDEICRAGREGLIDRSDPRYTAGLVERARTGKIHLWEVQCVRKDGSRFLAEVSSVVLEGGKAAFVILRDITARKQLEERAARLAAVMESSDDAILAKTLEGKITFWNEAAEKIYGYSAEEVIGQSVSSLLPEDNQNEVYEILQRIRRGEMVHHYETVRRRKDGGFVHVSVTISPIKDESGKLIGASTIARDITNWKQMEAEREKLISELQEALEKVKMLSGLLPICAHCKKIRDDQGSWQQVESYIHNHSEAVFSHAICPECAKKFYPELPQE